MIKSEYKDSVNLLQSALQRLNEVLSEDIFKHPAFVDATIQRFEFSIELFWKGLKKNYCMIMELKPNHPNQFCSNLMSIN